MITARFAKKAYLAIIFFTAASVFIKNAEAASGNVQICNPGSSCQIGEFVYDDSYNKVNTATCTITTNQPDGSFLFNEDSLPLSAQNDGWYSKSFTAPSTEGLYRTAICCTVSGQKMCLDKSFEVRQQATLSQSDVASAVWDAKRSSHNNSGSFGEALQNVVPSASDIATSIWGYSNRSLSTFNSLVSDIWNNPSRTLSDNSSTNVATTAASLNNKETNSGNPFKIGAEVPIFAVWGLVAVLILGFVVLVLYLFATRGHDKTPEQAEQTVLPPLIEDSYEGMPIRKRPPLIYNPPQKKFPISRLIKLAIVLVVILVPFGGGAYAFASFKQPAILQSVSQTLPTPPVTLKTKPAGPEAPLKQGQVNISVPNNGQVSVFTSPSISSPVLASLNTSRLALQTDRQGNLVNVKVKDNNGKMISGWVAQSYVSFVLAPVKVTVTSTPTGFLRVRKTPGGEEITKLNPGDQFTAIREENGWMLVALEDGTLGWVSKEYVKKISS